MNCDDEEFRHMPGPYLLGALDEPDRSAFTDHLRSCERCRTEIAQLQPVVSMLAGLTIDDVAPIDAADNEALGRDAASPDTRSAPVAIPDTLLPGLLARASRVQRRRHLLVVSVSGIAAAAIIALTVVLIGPFGTGPASTASAQVLVMAPASGSPIRATASVAGMPWGTEITLHCRYESLPAAGSGYGPGASAMQVYSLRVTDVSGAIHDLGSWSVPVGQQSDFTSGTAVPRDEIGSIKVLSADGETVLPLDR